MFLKYWGRIRNKVLLQLARKSFRQSRKVQLKHFRPRSAHTKTLCGTLNFPISLHQRQRRRPAAPQSITAGATNRFLTLLKFNLKFCAKQQLRSCLKIFFVV